MTSRIDGPLKVTGRARYGLDHNFPGMLHGYVVTSTIASGEIFAMDVTAAKSAPGVVAVYSPFDPLTLRRPNNPMLGETWVPLQDRDVAYYGQPIGFVVAQTYEQARDAAMLVEVSYDERPARTSLQANLDLAEDGPPAMDGAPPTHAVLAPGVESIEEALAASPVVVEGTYSTAAQNHAAMEPHSAVALWDDDGLTIYSGNADSIKAKGGPIDWVAVEPLVGRPQAIALAKNAPHPNAALLFADFVLSPEGQKLLGDMGRVPSSRTQKTLLDEHKYVMVDPIKWTDEAPKWEKVWNELFLK